jgi:glycosyltransferase involved in cell wall biosynthesis
MAEGPAVPTISVVMPTFNRQRGLKQVLSPLLEDPVASEIIVVVDGSRDGSYEYLQDLATISPRLIPLWIENSGEGYARAAGAARSTSEVILLLDDDVRATTGLIAGHARWHAGAPRRVVVGYTPLADASVAQGGFATRLYSAEYEGRCRQYEAVPGKILERLWAGNFSVRREDCLAVGLGSDTYTERYHPDRELGLRFAEAGMHAVFDRSLRAEHLHHRDLKSFRRDARSQGAGRRRLAELHPSRVTFSIDEFSSGVPAPVAFLIRAARRPRAGRILANALASAVRGLGRARLRRAELDAGRLLRRIEQTRGASTPHALQLPVSEGSGAGVS